MTSRARYITFPLDEGLVVARRDGHRLFLMNESARFIWERFAQDVGETQIARALAEHYRIDVQRAHGDVREVIGRWQTEGLVPAPGRRGRYRIAGFDFTVRHADARSQAAIDPILAHLAVAAPANDHDEGREFDIAWEDEAFVLRMDGVDALRSPDLAAIVEKLTPNVTLYAYDKVDWVLSVHAAAVGTPKGCVLMPGESGFGKSTLTVSLLMSGRLLYASEDLGLLERDTLRAIPVPGPLSLKGASWDLLAPMIPDLMSRPVYHRSSKALRFWAPPAWQIAREPLPVKAIVFPRYRQGAATTCKRLPTIEGLSRLIGAPATIKAPITDDLIERIVGWCRERPCYALTYDSLPEATRIVEELLA